MTKMSLVVRKVQDQNRINFVLTAYLNPEYPNVAQPYPYLADLLGGWFHQDFDIEGETAEEIIGAFNKSSTAQQRQAV